jgi:plastocyanin
MRKYLVLTSVLVVLALGAVAAQAATKSVAWKEKSKVSLRISKNDTVKWVWADGKKHNVRGPGLSSSFKTGKGKSVSRKFTKRGTFTYVCDVHSSMKTTVKVK